ncbi:MAG TPA: hypothetical protein VIJ94_09335 [Caulobacteraceae bacterium]
MKKLVTLAAAAALCLSASAALAQGPGGADNPPGYPPASGCSITVNAPADTHYGNLRPFLGPDPVPVPHDPHCPG